MLTTLVNFLAYFETEEAGKEEVEDEVVTMKKEAAKNEKRLIEEERLLGQAKQVNQFNDFRDC